MNKNKETHFEIERKFLTNNKLDLTKAISSHEIKQSYLSNKPAIRVRIYDNIRAELTFKRNVGKNKDIEQNIPVSISDAELMIKDFLDDVVIHKTRYIIKIKNRKWEVDIFHGGLKGLIVAEIESDCVDDIMNIDLPDWIEKEISEDYSYKNGNLFSILKNKKTWNDVKSKYQ